MLKAAVQLLAETHERPEGGFPLSQLYDRSFLLSITLGEQRKGYFMPDTSIPHSSLTMVEIPCPQGDQGLYEKLYRECYAQAYSRAYYLLHCHEDAEDAVQAAYITVWHRWPDLEPRGLQGYLLRVVTCRAIEILRRKQCRPAISLEANQIDAAVWWDIDTRIDLQALCATLKTDQQELVEMFAEGCTWREINKQLGLTRMQIYRRLDKAWVQLRKQVAA